MSRMCRRIQGALSEGFGTAVLRQDDLAREHIAECDECFAALETMTALDDSLRELPAVDAPDQLVARVLETVRLDLAEEGSTARAGAWLAPALAGARNRVLALAVAAWSSAKSLFAISVRHRRGVAIAATAALAVVVVRTGFESDRSALEESGAKNFVTQQLRFEAPLPEEQLSELEAVGYLVSNDDRDATERGYGDYSGELSLDESKKLEGQVGASTSGGRLNLQKVVPSFKPPAKEKAHSKRKQALDSTISESQSAYFFEIEVSKNAEVSATDKLLVDHFSGGKGGTIKGDPKNSSSVRHGDRVVRGADESQQKMNEDVVDTVDRQDSAQAVLSIPKPRAREADIATIANEDDLPLWVGTESNVTFRAPDAAKIEAARHFVAERRRTDGLSFQQPHGYWSNAYVPGDPVFRLLQARLGVDSDDTVDGGASAVELHDSAHQTSQPFDAPVNAALAVYLQSDLRSTNGESRALVQVGLQATDRHGGRRPALDAALILDLTGEIDPETSASMRALVSALADRRDLGDRFHLIVAGRPGGEIVGADDFRHGTLVVAMEELFGLGGSALPTLDLEQAVTLAGELVRRGDASASSPLGSSVVMLATARELGDGLTASLTTAAHRSALAGVPLSVVGVGDRFSRRELDRLALAGQGNRRLLSAALEAPALVDRELSAVSRVVARALRLSIRLAPGVELVEVLGSRRLDGVKAEEVREAERSIDLSLARSLGIDADRGEDEEGIQMVIPSFYAGDSHVVVLDVVVPGPGAVADVTVRYKDLVHLRNGTGRDHLSLPSGELPVGPLEINVLKNLLAFRLFETLETSGRFLMRDDLVAASSVLEVFADLLEGLQNEIPGLAKDRDVISDVAMLREYRKLLESSSEETLELRELRSRLVDSMRYAARLKILPQPVGPKR